jgi:hypothetical protein
METSERPLCPFPTCSITQARPRRCLHLRTDTEQEARNPDTRRARTGTTARPSARRVPDTDILAWLRQQARTTGQATGRRKVTESGALGSTRAERLRGLVIDEAHRVALRRASNARSLPSGLTASTSRTPSSAKPGAGRDHVRHPGRTRLGRTRAACTGTWWATCLSRPQSRPSARPLLGWRARTDACPNSIASCPLGPSGMPSSPAREVPARGDTGPGSGHGIRARGGPD